MRALLPDPPAVLTSSNARLGLAEVASVAELQPLIDESILIDLPAGALVSGRGMRQQTVYLVLDGTVEITWEDQVLETCGTGRFVGEAAFLLDRHRTHDVWTGPAGASLLAFDHRALSRKTDAAGRFWRSVAADASAKRVAMTAGAAMTQRGWAGRGAATTNSRQAARSS